jgi:calcineurin-like phosphoesterase family protein
MDAALIANWNAVVGRTDDVWHLGDFAYSKDATYIAGVFAHLNGRKNIVLGNHDHRHTQELPWASVQRLVGIKVDKRLVVLCHFAMRVWPSSHYGSLHLYGHSHGNLPGTRQSCDVGVDCWDYRPVSLNEIRERLAATGEQP